MWCRPGAAKRRWWRYDNAALKLWPVWYIYHIGQMAAQDTPLEFIGSSRDDLSAFPLPVKQRIGFALPTAQKGGKHPDAKPLKGFKGAGILEIVSDFDGDTFRAVYTVRLRGVVYLLHAFQKKAGEGSRRRNLK